MLVAGGSSDLPIEIDRKKGLEGWYMEPLMTVTDVARYLKVTPRTVYSFLESGTLKGIKIGRSWRVRRTDLERLGQETTASSLSVSITKGDTLTDLRHRLASEISDLTDQEIEGLLHCVNLIRGDRGAKRYKGVFDSVPCATLVVDPSGYIVDANDSALRVFALSKDDLASMKASEIPVLSGLKDLHSLIEAANRDKTCSSIPCRDQEVDGTPIRHIWILPSNSSDVIIRVCCGGIFGDASAGANG